MNPRKPGTGMRIIPGEELKVAGQDPFAGQSHSGSNLNDSEFSEFVRCMNAASLWMVDTEGRLVEWTFSAEVLSGSGDGSEHSERETGDATSCGSDG